MFLVEKTHLTSHFKLIGKKVKKPSPVSPLPKTYQLAAQSFDEKVIFHLKTLDLGHVASSSSIISLNWMNKAVTFLSTVHLEAQAQISNLRSETDYYNNMYMDYSQKVLDLANLVSSAVKQLTERRMLLNLSLRLLNSSGDGQIPSPEKLNKAKDTLNRSVNVNHAQDVSKALRAKDLLKELSDVINGLPIGKDVNTVTDLIRHMLYGLGVLTVFIVSVLVTVLYGRLDVVDLVEVRVPTEFRWADSVTAVQKQVIELIKPKLLLLNDNNKNNNIRLLEVEETVNRGLTVCGVIDEVAVGGDGDYGGDGQKNRLEDGVKELKAVVERFSDGVDMLTNGVNGLFGSVLKTRNGVLDGVRKGDW